MISLSATTGGVRFIFENSSYYLYGNGTIDTPVNSLLLVDDGSDAVIFKKIDGDVFVSAPVAEFGMSKAEIEAFYKENMVGSTGGGGDITSGEVQTMIDESISGKADTSSLATVATTGDYDDLLNKPTIPVVPTSNTAFTNDAGYITEDAISGKADTSAVTAVNDVLTAHTANTTIHVTAGDKLTWDGKQDALTAGTGIDITNDVISCTVTGGNNVVELTQAQYDALVDKDPDAFYIITDAPAIDLSGYAQTSAVTAEINAAVSGKQDTLVSGTNIKTINNESLLGSGNIDIQGGGGVNVVQTTGSSTADVMSQSAVTTQLNGYVNSIDTDVEGSYVRFFRFSTPSNFNYFLLRNAKINGRQVLAKGYSTAINQFNLVETSAITTSVTSSSTDAQVPSAKAVYDALGQGGGAASSAITSGDTNAVAGGAVYDKFDEVEQVTAAALNALNDNFGGLKLVKLTQQEYDDLAVKNNNILYVVI